MTAERPLDPDLIDYDDGIDSPEIRRAEIQLYRDQNFLPHIYRRPEAIAAVDSIIEREDFTPEAVFRALSAAHDTFEKEESDLEDRMDEDFPPEYLDADFVEDHEEQGSEVTFYGWKGRTNVQNFGFRQDLIITHVREAPNEDLPRAEEIVILKSIEVMEMGSEGQEFIDYTVLRRNKDGSVSAFRRVELGEEFDPDNEVFEEHITLSPIECKTIIGVIKGYLDHSPFGAAGIKPPEIPDNDYPQQQ